MYITLYLNSKPWCFLFLHCLGYEGILLLLKGTFGIFAFIALQHPKIHGHAYASSSGNILPDQLVTCSRILIAHWSHNCDMYWRGAKSFSAEEWILMPLFLLLTKVTNKFQLLLACYGFSELQGKPCTPRGVLNRSNILYNDENKLHHMVSWRTIPSAVPCGSAT